MTAADMAHPSFTLEYEIVDLDTAAVVAAGRSVQVCYDYGAQRSTAIPAAVRSRLEREIIA